MRDCGLSTRCYRCGLAGQERVLKTFPGSGYLVSDDGVVWLWHPLVNWYVWLTSSSCYCSIPLALGLIVSDVGLCTQCHSCGFACQQRVGKKFPGTGYLHIEDGVLWLWHPLVNLYLCLTISSCYGSIPLALGLIGRDGGFSTLCHSCGLACQPRVIKTLPGFGYLHSKDGVVWLWHPLLNLYVWLIISSCYCSIPLALRLIVKDGGLSTLCHSCGFSCQQKVLKGFSCPGYLHFEDGVLWLWHPLVNLYVWLTISSCYGSIPVALGLIARDGGLSTLCHSCGFAFQQRVLKTFPVPGYLHSRDEVVWLWHPLVNLYVWHKISSCYGSIPLAWGLIVRDGGLSTLCHSCRFACQQTLLKTFLDPGNLHSKDGVVWLGHPLVNFYIWLTISSCYGSIPLAWGLKVRDGGLRTLYRSCGLICEQRLLIMFPSPGYLLSQDGVFCICI